MTATSVCVAARKVPNERKIYGDIGLARHSMMRLTRLWFVVAALAMTALLAIAAGPLASLGMRVILAAREKWWWPLALNMSMITGWLIAFVPIGIALHRRRVFRHRDHGIGLPDRGHH